MKKIYIFLLAIFLIVSVVAFEEFSEPWNTNQRSGGYNLTGIGYLQGSILNFTTSYIVNQSVYTNGMNWTNLQNFPAPCPGSSAVTTLNGSVVCSDLWVNSAGDNMTGNLNIGSNNITDVMFMSFNITGCPEDINTTLEGFTCWNSQKKTLNIVTGLGNIIQLSQEMFKVVKNKAGKTIYSGQVVSSNSSSGEVVEVVLANANVTNTELHNLAVVTVPSCNANADCVVTNYGEVHDIDTSAFSEGDSIYLSCDGSGNITNTIQKFPNCYNYHLGKITRVHASTGILDFQPEVDFDNGVVIHELGILTNLTILGEINVSQNIFSEGNLSLTDKITFGFGQFIDNIVDGWLRVNGNLNITGDLYVEGNFTGNQIYGEMWMDNETSYVTTPIASQNVWYNISGFNSTALAVTGQSLNGFSFDDANEHLTVLVSGKYMAHYTFSFSNAGNNEEYQIAFAINDVIQANTQSHRKIGVGGDVGNTGASGFLDLSVGDKVHLMVIDITATADVRSHAINLNLVRIGE